MVEKKNLNQQLDEMSTEIDKAEYKRQTGLGDLLQHSDIDV